MLKKNDRLVIDITDYTDEGLGVGKVMTEEGTFALFVKDTAAGDRAEVIVTRLNKNYGYGKPVRVLEPSPDRVDPECPVASCCGGCTLNEREMKYRTACAKDAGIPMTNYGILIAYMQGILKRSVEAFPSIAMLLDRTGK